MPIKICIIKIPLPIQLLNTRAKNVVSYSTLKKKNVHIFKTNECETQLLMLIKNLFGHIIIEIRISN